MHTQDFLNPRLVGDRFAGHALRLEELAELKDGWLDGQGIAPAADKLRWLASCFDRYFAPSLCLPYLYPTAEGGIQAEWSLPDHWEVTLEIDLVTQRASYQAVNLQTQASQDHDMDLAQTAGWTLLNQWLTEIGGVEA
jgi:hypothetical protein